ncbi:MULTISPECIES: O-antigen ligase family protein [unclassified Bosea (in: a-proteobacteria)]|uniref:O-antigen ligase family protein n=1 Tax=unclassified Bosea (in: a-proteobacteria) TaxID=2653178 RepID=UPI001F23FF42|nr:MULTISPECIES: O-antigen ligase family protein [unclassified Bosea (in: a-proteobacteria)]
MPLAMWLANRSAPLMLGLAAAAFLGAALLSEPAGASIARLRRLLTAQVALAIAAFLAWALISIGWSHKLSGSLQAWGELVLPIGFALAIAASGQWRPTLPLLRALALAIIAAAVLVMIELASGLSQRAALGTGKMMSFVFNRPAIVLLLLAVPTAHALWSRSAGWLDRVLAALLAAAVVVFVFRSESEAAKLGALVLILCWAFAAIVPRVALAATALAFVLTMAIAPWLGPIAEKLVPSFVLNRLDVMSAQARIDIWDSFGEVARARPIAGAGFGTSATMHEHKVAAEVSAEHRVLLGVGHPHDMPLQAWAETGVIGAGLLTLAGLLLLARLRQLPAVELAPRLAIFTAAFSIATVGHGAWQGWWIAGLGAATLWFAMDAAPRQGDAHG